MTNLFGPHELTVCVLPVQQENKAKQPMTQEAVLVPSHRKDFESRFKSAGRTALASSP